MMRSPSWCGLLAPAVAHAAAFRAIPEPTLFAPALDVWSPAPTEAPQFPGFELFKRQDAVGNNTCGFVSGSSQSSITCYASNAVCATNTYFGVQGCCDPASLSACVLPTTCIPAKAMSTECTDMACSTNAAIAKCTGSGMGECQEFLVVYPSTTMTQHNCAASSATLTVQRSLGGSTTAQPTKIITVTAPAASSPTGTSESSPTSSSSLGAIVGGTIGGCVFLSVIALIVFLIYRRRRARREAQPVPPPVSHYHHPSITETKAPAATYHPVEYPHTDSFQVPVEWVEEDHKLWQQHQRYQSQRPSADYGSTSQMPNYPGMTNNGILQLDSSERPAEAPYYGAEHRTYN